ncbi:MAG: DUF1349 domain-containing protein [Anaerolineae bacterium]|nr:DUF1349 domain-containing protein [Anaerolineae bacterium]MCA9907847.1 DUF1349 domain-containing protein [Anaerolineae bacterium]
MNWLNPPKSWHQDDRRLTVTTSARTDFWRKTHDGGIRDTGHFYYQEVEGDFELQLKVSGAYTELYDQAGAMVRVDESNWMKCGVELLNGVQQASVVMTRDFSDWSVIALPQDPPSLWLRVRRHGTTLEVEYSLDDKQYHLMRQASLLMQPVVQVGMMCCSPTGDGFTTTFEDFVVRSR